MQDVLDALAAQQAELGGLLADLDDDGWLRPSRCDGWTVADVVAHLAQTNELAVGSATGRLGAVVEELGFGAGGTATSVDDAADQLVVQDRGVPGAAVGARWRRSADALHAALAACDPSRRLDWVAGQLSARTLAATRLSETWIHTDDVAHAFGLAPVATDRLRFVARLAWRTVPYAFTRAGRTLAGPVAVRLRAPGGAEWRFEPDDGTPVTTIEGDALEWCLVAGRRVEASATGLRAEGPDGAAVLELVRTYA